MKPKWELFLICAIYFVQCLVWCCVSNFMALYLNHRGLGVNEVGIIVGAVYPFAQLLGQPMWSAIADRTRRHKACMLLSLALGTCVVFSTVFMTTFLSLALNIGAGAFLSSAVNPLLDNTTMMSLQHHGVPLSHYGRYRVFGAVGWGVAALALGPLIDKLGVESIFYAYGVSSIVFIGLVTLLPFRSRRSNAEQLSINPSAKGDSSDEHKEASDHEPLVQSPELRGGYLSQLLSQKYTLLFFFMVICMGLGKGVIDCFLFLFLQDMGGPGLLMGLSLAVTTVSEIPFFFYSGELIKRCGAIYTVALALCAYAARLLYYSQLTHPWWVLPIGMCVCV